MALEYKQKLTEIFESSNISEQQIDETINLVLEEMPDCNSEEGLEQMINLLIESGDSTLVRDEEGATGISLPNINNHENEDFELYFENDDQTPERDPLDVWDQLKQMLPNADPDYLKNQARVLATRPPEELDAFIENAVEKNDYPTLQQYLINKESAAEFETYITRFSVDAYLEKVPNPIETFSDPKRKSVIQDENIDDLEFAQTFLSNQFPFQRKKEILKVFLHFEKNLMQTCNKLKTFPKAFRHPRKSVALTECKNVELLQEVSFIKHEKIIRQFLKQRDEHYRLALEEARSNGLLQTCSCCFDDELIPEECYFCKKNCIFCKDCVKQGAENVIGKEETRFPCLADCDSEFDYSTLQMVLDSKTFGQIWHRKQIEEIKNANIDGLETCPFCDYCMIPNQDDKIFKCANVDCMIESCRLCRHKSHVPLRCNEIEYDEDVKMRTFIENKMTEALLRKCWQCSKQFYKESGCNKMTCVCGARMCYVCGAAVNDYSHFNTGRCPLYTENLHQFHLDRVRQGAALAKDELGINENPDKLKFDPTRGIETDVA